MARDDISICNLALSRIGISLKIDSLDQRTKEAIELSNVIDDVRDRVLASAPWPFARKFVSLAKTGSAPFRWAFRYEYPNDCVKVRSVHPPRPAGTSLAAFRKLLLENRVPYELEVGDDGGTTICTDQDQAVIQYTARITNPTVFDALFTSSFAWALASEVALSLAKTIDHAKNAGAMYQQTVNDALAAALNEEVRDEDPDSEFIRARY